MASGLVRRANRPNTWLHRPACKREKSLANSEPSTHGTKRTYRDVCYLTAFGGKADITPRWVPVDPAAPLRLLLASLGAGDPHFVRVTALV
jgi:hypothetical protein